VETASVGAGQDISLGDILGTAGTHHAHVGLFFGTAGDANAINPQ